MRRRALILFLLLAGPAAGQDERRVSSPNGQLEFRIGVAQPEGGGLFRLAYQILDRGKTLVETSYLGLDILNQEPLLGENLGLTGEARSKEKAFNSLIVEYMQNGSLGRRINVEIRAADDGIAFRYLIPRSTPLEEILISDEVTEFATGEQTPSRVSLPFVAERRSGGWMAITESKIEGYPPASLEREPSGILLTHLSTPFEGKTPLAGP